MARRRTRLETAGEIGGCRMSHYSDHPDLLDQLLSGREQSISLSQAARLPGLSIDGRPASIAKVHRLCHVGTRGVSLDHARIGGRVVTSPEAVARFARAVNQPRPADRHRKTPAAEHTKAHIAAVGQLQAAGIL
jgi:hypothetical protein